MTLLINILLGFYAFVALLMVLVILMQRPKSEGLGAAFGGGVTENIFGAQTTNVLTKITSWLAAIFFLLTFALSILYANKSKAPSDLSRELMKDFPTPVATSPTPASTTALATDPSPTPAASPSSETGTPGPSASPSPDASTPATTATPVDLAISATSTPIPTTPAPDSVGPADSVATPTPSTQPRRRRR